ncbi:MAG TPA: hypothetical protein PK079_17000 [Leptospiraceae bacterium]|nr:hypothetical protein [Leptospiraceae bacterium]HMW06137.1 hypothetical protein [Leptospiraceae bacterium]HMX30735.1 hypothetical protein [Leptospiraceae bacterium]HMY31798.1 hypothetical protein [Leptospiraceae bacterium]HMZ63129.1 hypothetical protein [Leptospiraceae bacterium]
MLYFANLTSIILFVFGISFVVAEPWTKSERKIVKFEGKSNSKITLNDHYSK